MSVPEAKDAGSKKSEPPPSMRMIQIYKKKSKTATRTGDRKEDGVQ